MSLKHINCHLHLEGDNFQKFTIEEKHLSYHFKLII